VALCQAAWAATGPLPPAARRASLLAHARHAGIPHYQHAGRVFLNVSGQQHIDTIKAALPPGSNVFEIVGTGESDQPRDWHARAMFDGQLIHFPTPPAPVDQQRNPSGLRRFGKLAYWGYHGPTRTSPVSVSLRPSAKPIVSALIQLTPLEARNLRALLGAAWRASAARSPDSRALDASFRTFALARALGIDPHRMNCITPWRTMPIGAGGESVHEIAGLEPRHGRKGTGSWLRDLRRYGNERVFGYAVYGPRVPGFGARPDEPLAGL
jgi:hypothetical protein